MGPHFAGVVCMRAPDGILLYIKVYDKIYSLRRDEDVSSVLKSHSCTPALACVSQEVGGRGIPPVGSRARLGGLVLTQVPRVSGIYVPISHLALWHEGCAVSNQTTL